MADLMNYIRQGLPCLFHELTGLYCPGCGGTRAVKALLRGELVTSFFYHPVVIYTAVVLLGILLLYAISKVLHRNFYKIRHYEWFAYVGIVIILINWVIKNYYLLAKGIDLLIYLE